MARPIVPCAPQASQNCSGSRRGRLVPYRGPETTGASRRLANAPELSRGAGCELLSQTAWGRRRLQLLVRPRAVGSLPSSLGIRGIRVAVGKCCRHGTFLYPHKHADVDNTVSCQFAGDTPNHSLRDRWQLSRRHRQSSGLFEPHHSAGHGASPCLTHVVRHNAAAILLHRPISHDGCHDAYGVTIRQ